MNKVARITGEMGQSDKLSVDLDALQAARVATSPFPYLIVPGFVRSGALDAISADFPAIEHPGSFPLQSLRYGPGFVRFIADLQAPEMARVVGGKLGLDLASSPTMVTVRGQSREADGKIHTDSRTKLVTALIYMNESWESSRGRLRLVRSATDLNDVVAEVPPERGTLLLFKNEPNAWHGFEPFAGPRRVVQLNWVTSAAVVRREQRRHRISAFFKRLFGRLA
jgi:SM-20-related protein